MQRPLEAGGREVVEAIQRCPIVHVGAEPKLVTPEDVRVLKAALQGMLIMRSIPVVDDTSMASR